MARRACEPRLWNPICTLRPEMAAASQSRLKSASEATGGFSR
jgi:hypothetical protein